MTRRGRPFTGSLFAFQDVITALTGVLFFVVLLMALDMVRRVTPEAKASQAASLATELADLTDRRDQLQRRVNTLTDQLNVVSAQSETEIAEDIRRMARRVEFELTRLRELQAEVDQAAAQTAVAERRLVDVEGELLDAEEQLERAKAKATSAQPTVMYIVDEAVDRQPWLAELSGQAIRVGSPDGTSFRLDFTGSSAQGRLDKLVTWARSLNRRRDYFVLLIKPSAGARHAVAVEIALRRAGFWTGKDLLPEAWDPFGG